MEVTGIPMLTVQGQGAPTVCCSGNGPRLSRSRKQRQRAVMQVALVPAVTPLPLAATTMAMAMILTPGVASR